MNIQSLRYLLTIQQCGSMNLAARQLYISQSSLSRVVKDQECRLGFPVFRRTSRGMIPTGQGQLFLEQVRHLVEQADQLERQFFAQPSDPEALFVVTQRCTPVVNAFSQYYIQYCQTQPIVNLALLEETTDDIIRLVSSGVYGVGVLHDTSDREATFLQRLQDLQLSYTTLDRSPVAVQVRRDHPLADRTTLTIADLAAYPHVSFSDEDITRICYCSDIAQFEPEVLHKRILVQDRGTLRSTLLHTDSYYVGSDFTDLPQMDQGIRYLPLEDVPFTLNTLWIQRSDHVRTLPEQRFFEILLLFFQRRSPQ